MMNHVPAMRISLFLMILYIFITDTQAQRTDLKDAVQRIKIKTQQVGHAKTYQSLDSLFKLPEVEQDSSYGEAKWIYGILLQYDLKLQASIDTFSQLYQWAQNRNDTAYIIDALVETGYANLELGNFDSALSYQQRARSLLKNSRFRNRARTNLISLADIYIKQFKLFDASEALIEHIRMAETDRDTNSMIVGYSRLGQVYKMLNNLERADSVYQISLNIARIFAQDKSWPYKLQTLATPLAGYGILKKERGQYDQAAVMYEEAYQIADSFNYPGYKISLSINQGILAYEQGKYQDAAFYLQRSRNLLQTIPSPLSRQLNEIQILGAKLLYQAGNFRQALDSVNVALRNSREIGETDNYLDGLKTKVDILRGMGQYLGALTLFEEYTILNDSLKADKTTLQIAQLEASFLKEKQARQIQEQDNQIQILAQQNLIARQQRNTTFSISLLVLFILIAAFLGWNRYRNVLQQQIRREAKHWQQLNQQKSRFLANIAHEFRTPLTLVSGPIDHFIDTYAKPLPQNQISWLHKASQNSHRLNRMVKEIFDLSKLEDQKLETDLKPLNIRNAINQNVAFFDSAARLKSQQLSVSIGDELPEVVMMDREKLETILNNLISNALKFTPFQGSVTVTASWQNNMLSILVSDTGRGISADDLPHIFERYFQTNNTNMPLEGGAGIGLALSRELAQLMKGDLTAESTQPNGSVFSLTLPAIPTKADPVQYPTPPTKADTSAITSQTSVNNLTTQTNATILLVEDNLDMQAYIHELLQDQYAIFTATNGEHALHLLEKMDQLPDAIISDLMMPGMDGFTLLNHLKKDDRYAWIPTVMLTARSDARDKLQALTIGVDDYITKPFSAHELRIRINNLITKRKEALKYNSSSANNPEQQNEQLKPPSARDLKWLQSAEQALLSAIDQPDLTNHDLAKELALSERQVARKIKQITGLSPNKYFREIRLQYARELLEKGEVATVNEAAFAVGFDTPSYFSRLFEERFGRRPSDFL